MAAGSCWRMAAAARRTARPTRQPARPPHASSRELRELPDMLIQDWRPRVEAGQTMRVRGRTDAVHRGTGSDLGLLSPARRPLAAATAGPRPQRPWRSPGCRRAGQMAAAPAGRRSQVLQLPRYQQQPEDLAEQSPRMERMLVWLHLARGVLSCRKPTVSTANWAAPRNGPSAAGRSSARATRRAGPSGMDAQGLEAAGK